MRALRIVNLAICIYMLINGKSQDVQILAFLLLPLVVLSIVGNFKKG